MELTLQEKQIYGDSADITEKTEDYTVYRIHNDSGDAIMTSYRVFPGISLVYNDVHTREIAAETMPPPNVLEINHCREGRIECRFENGEYLYVEKGDLSIHKKDGAVHQSYFPTSHYHGVSICVDMMVASDYLTDILEGVSIDMQRIADQIAEDKIYTIIRNDVSFEHIFSELYTIPEQIRKEYQKIKVLEMLIFLNGQKFDNITVRKKHYDKEQVEMIKEIEAFLTGNDSVHFTIEELSERFHFPMTSMKNCFKDVFGTSIYAYVRNYRMQHAAGLLRETNKTILEIAGLVGYENGSKFANAFHTVMGESPKHYRKGSV